MNIINKSLQIIHLKFEPNTKPNCAVSSKMNFCPFLASGPIRGTPYLFLYNRKNDKNER